MNESSFQAGLLEHLSALQARDITRFSATVADDVTVVDGRGALCSGRDAVLRSHAEWFASADHWTFDYAIRLSRAFAGSGFALIEVSYRQTPAATPSVFLLTLIFEQSSDGVWRFVYDQNTPLAAAES